MKPLILSFVLAVAISAAYAEVIQNEDFSVYDYHRKYGIPQARKIREAEELAVLENDQSRIVGGSVTNIAQIPYQAGLYIQLISILTSICGASIISNTRVVTAAHCYNDGFLIAQSFTVVLGSNTIFYDGHRVRTTDISVHPNWDFRTAANDIAVIRIPFVNFNNVIQPIALPTGTQLNNNFAGWTALASGWGITRDGDVSNLLQVLNSVNLPVITNQQCAAVFGDFVHASNICTSGEGGRGICSGDSGGPLVVNISGTRVLVGVSSYAARAGCQAGFPAGYARVTSFASWIMQQ